MSQDYKNRLLRLNLLNGIKDHQQLANTRVRLDRCRDKILLGLQTSFMQHQAIQCMEVRFTTLKCCRIYHYLLITIS